METPDPNTRTCRKLWRWNPEVFENMIRNTKHIDELLNDNIRDAYVKTTVVMWRKNDQVSILSKWLLSYVFMAGSPAAN